MSWGARLKRIQHSEYLFSLHEGANYAQQAVFSNLCSHMTGSSNKSILAEGAMTIPVALSEGVLFAN